MRISRSLSLATLMALAGTSPLLAQSSAPEPAAVPALTEAMGESTGSTTQGDSGVGLNNEAEAWIGQSVVGADGTTIGTLKAVKSISDSSTDSALLIVEQASGAGDIEVPLQGATSDGTTVTTSGDAGGATTN